MVNNNSTPWLNKKASDGEREVAEMVAASSQFPCRRVHLLAPIHMYV